MPSRHTASIPLALERGITLIETIVFLVVIAISLTALAMVFDQRMSHESSVNAAVRLRALEMAQAKLDEILARKFDENTPPGGIPACGSANGPACAGIVPDTDFDDVGDYNGYNESNGVHALSVNVVEAGSDFGQANNLARRITVTVSVPGGSPLVLAAYRVNF
ncbi:type II secretion system protein [Teredinibacter turnerae]|uniref:MSHA pilin protein, MshD n=1 Tax=Teredinibacter turnerae TaxID=2426 RepID=UPI00036C6D4C|nr:MSHA pilin protein, MshD [Teredinibacter turnerae]